MNLDDKDVGMGKYERVSAGTVGVMNDFLCHGVYASSCSLSFS